MHACAYLYACMCVLEFVRVCVNVYMHYVCVSVCMDMCISARVSSVHAYVCVHTHACMRYTCAFNGHMHVRARAHVHACMHACKCASVRCVWMCTHVCAHVFGRTHTFKGNFLDLTVFPDHHSTMILNMSVGVSVGVGVGVSVGRNAKQIRTKK